MRACGALAVYKSSPGPEIVMGIFLKRNREKRVHDTGPWRQVLCVHVFMIFLYVVGSHTKQCFDRSDIAVL